MTRDIDELNVKVHTEGSDKLKAGRIYISGQSVYEGLGRLFMRDQEFMRVQRVYEMPSKESTKPRESIKCQ